MLLRRMNLQKEKIKFASKTFPRRKTSSPDNYTELHQTFLLNI